MTNAKALLRYALPIDCKPIRQVQRELEAVLAQAEREGLREEREPTAGGLRQRGRGREPMIDQRLRQPSRRRQRQGPAED